MTSTREHLERAAFLAALIARHSTATPGLISVQVPYLQRLAHQAKRAEERYCSEPDFDRDAKLARLQKHVDAIAAELGPAFHIRLGGDCRGPCAHLYLTSDSKAGDGWGDGYAIF